jgi:hypothetical protein
MLVALATSNLIIPAALTLLDYHYLCQWRVRRKKYKNNKYEIYQIHKIADHDTQHNDTQHK